MAPAVPRRGPGGLFWKVFAACWFTSMLTGLSINLLAQIFPAMVDLPPTPPRLEQSVLMPVLTGGCIALLLSAVLAWSLSRPLRVLREAFGAAASGQLALRVTPQLGRQRDEFADLGRDYDRMAQQLQALLGAQRRLLHDVSHELRSPLARLQMTVGLLQRAPDGNERALSRIEREIERLDALVGEVLTLARLESGAAPGACSEVDVIALLASVAEDARFEARSQGRDLRFQSPVDSLVMPARGELLLRAFENVIRNAVKYTAAGSLVEVVVTQLGSPDRLMVCVADRGPGLPPEALTRIFEPFERVASGEHAPGFGLGLAIARRAVTAHGGQIEASLRDGGGLLMCLTLPVPHRSA